MPPQNKVDIKDWLQAFDEEFPTVESSKPANQLQTLSDIVDSERQHSSVANKRRMRNAPESTFGSQLIWGFSESAMVAPSLWESLGKQAGMDVEKGDIKESILGEQADIEWEDQTGWGKAGYIVGAGAGMFIPFKAAGNVVKFGLGVGGKAFQGVQKGLGFTPFLTNASKREITERVGKLSGNKITKLADETDVSKIVETAQEAVSKKGAWNTIWNFKRNTDKANNVIAAEVKAGLHQIPSIPAAAVDDIAEMAVSAVKYNSPWNAHAILENSIGRFGGVTTDVMAAMAYDGMLGVAFGYGRAMAKDYAKQSWSPGQDGKLKFTEWNPDTAHAFSEALDEGKWLSLLGPVRMVAGGTGRPLLTVPRFWNKNPGVINKIVGGVTRSWKPLSKVDPLEAEATLAMMHHVSGGAIKEYTRKYPLLAKAFKDSPSAWWKEIPKDKLPEALKLVRRGFTRNALPIIGKEAGADLLASIPRMGMGAIAMNASSVADVWNHTQGLTTSDRIKWTAGSSFGEGIHDTMANVLVAAMMMRSGRGFRDFTKPSGFFARGDTKQMMDKWRGRDTYVKEVVAGLDKLGMSAKDRYNFAQKYYRNEHFPEHYTDALLVNMLETVPEYKAVSDRIRDKLLTGEEAKDLDIQKLAGEGNHPDVETALESFFVEKSTTDKDVKEIAEKFVVYKAIMNHYEQIVGKKLLFKPMTSKEAVELVRDFSEMKIDGKKVDRKTVSPALSLLGKKAFMDSTHESYQPIIEWYAGVADALGLESVQRDHERGVIFIPENLRFPQRPKEAKGNKEGRQINSLIESFDHVTQMGLKLGWLVKQKGRVTTDVNREQLLEALDIHNKTLLNQHKLVYGFEETFTTLDDGQIWDYDILSNHSWHNAYMSASKFRQGENVNLFMSGDFSSMKTSQSSKDIDRVGEKAQVLFGTTKTTIDKEGSNLKAEEMTELEKFVDNFNQMYGMTRQQATASGDGQKITVAEALDFKRDMESLVGDAFTNDRSIEYVSNELLETAVSKMDLPGVKSNLKRGIVSLLKDTDFSPSPGVLRGRAQIHSLLRTMGKSEGKNDAEVKMLQEFYDDLYMAVDNSKSQTVNFDGREIIPSDRNEAIWDALVKAEHSSRMEDVKLTLEEAVDVDFKLREALTQVNRQVDKLLDKETSEAVDSELFSLLEKRKDSMATLSQQISVAIKENNISALKAIRGDGVNIYDYISGIENALPNTANDAYHQEIFRIAEKIGELNNQIGAEEVSRITEERIKLNSDTDVVAVVEKQNKITEAQFLTKYQTRNQDMVSLIRTLNEPLQSDNSAIKLLENAKAEILRVNEVYKTDLDVKLFDDAINFVKDLAREGTSMDSGEIVDLIYEPMFDLVKSKIDSRLALGENGGITETKHAELLGDLHNDLQQIMTNAYSTKMVRMLEYYMGGFNLTKTPVPNTNQHGFLGIENLIPGLSGNIFLLKQSGVDAGGRLHTSITGEIFSEMESRLKQGDVMVNSLDARKRIAATEQTDLDAVSESLIGALHGREFFIKRMDEGTDLVLEINQDSHSALKNAFREGSPLMERLYEAISSRYKSIENGEIVLSDTMNSALDKFRNMEMSGKAMGDALFLSRIIIDSPLMAEGYILGNLKESAVKKDWRRLKMTQPKSGFYGTEDNVSFVYKTYEKILDMQQKQGITDSIQSKAFKNLRDVFGERGDGVLNILAIHDELESTETEFNPFSYRQTAVKKIDQMVADNRISPSEATDMKSKLERARSSVDAVTYLRKDAFEALMALFGVKDTMIQYTEDGSVLRAGSLKPMIHHAEVGENGRVKEFLLKTSFQYDPSIETLMPEGVHAIAFKSGAKKFLTRESWDSDVVEGFAHPSMVRADAQGDPMLRSTTLKVSDAVSNYTPDNVIGIPLSSLSLKSASREHTGNFSANTAVHFSDFGMEGANRWSNIVERMEVFKNKMQDVWLSPYTSTALARKLSGYSAEIGDTYLAQTGLDYVIQEGGILSQQWMVPIMERQVISAYLHGGNITTTPIYESSTDVMSPENGQLATPFRAMVERTGEGIPVQRIFGGHKVSSFNADKRLKIYDQQNARNSKPEDTHALIVRFDSNGKEGIMVEGENPTLYFDGLRVREKDGKVQIYDMAHNMHQEIETTDAMRESITDKFNNALTAQRQFAEGMDYGRNPRTARDAIDRAKDVVGEDGKQNVWLAGLSTRQPRNQAGDLILVKIEGVTDGRGNVSETNVVDAYQTLDSDNDFDKSTTYLASHGNVWGEASRLAGHTTFNKTVDIENFIEKQFAPYSNSAGYLDATSNKNNLVKTGIVRSRFVKQHQVLTYLRNIFGNSEIMRFQLPGEKNRVIGVRLKNSKTAYLNTSQTISKFVKHFIDVYKQTPRDWDSDTFVTEAFNRIYFHPQEGMFEIYNTNTGHVLTGDAIWDVSQAQISSQYHSAANAIHQRIFRPISRYVGYNRGDVMESDGYSRSAGINEFSAAYENVLFAFDAKSWQGIPSEARKSMYPGLEMIDMAPGLARARDYFSKRLSSPFDVAMRHMHNIKSKKFKDIDFFNSDIGNFIKMIEEGHVGDSGYEETKARIINNAYKQYVENDMNMYNVISLMKRIKSIDYRLSELQDKFKFGDEVMEVQELGKQRSRLSEAVEDLRQIMGAGHDWESARQGNFPKPEYAHEFKYDKDKKGKGSYGVGFWENSLGAAAVIRNKAGNVIEIIPNGKRNTQRIEAGYIAFKHGRHFEFRTEDQIGSYINYEAFAGKPAIFDNGRLIDNLSDGQYSRYDKWLVELHKSLQRIDNEFMNKKGVKITNRTSPMFGVISANRKRALHNLLINNNSVRINENSSLLDKFAFFHKMLQPQTDASKVLSFPVMVDGTPRMANMPHMEMHNFGRTEQLVVEYLNNVKDSKSTKMYENGILTPSEAETILQHIIKSQAGAFIKLRNPYADYRLALDGLSSVDVSLKNDYLFSDVILNQSVYDKTRHIDEGIRNAANVLVRYASGDGAMVDPSTIYKASMELERAKPEGIPSQKTFVQEGWETNTRSFGSPLPKGFTMLDRNRKTHNGYGVISQTPRQKAEEVTRCLKKR